MKLEYYLNNDGFVAGVVCKNIIDDVFVKEFLTDISEETGIEHFDHCILYEHELQIKVAYECMNSILDVLERKVA